MAKIASELDKPDGLVVVPPGTEQDLLRPMKVSVIPGRRPGHRRAAAPGRGAHRRGPGGGSPRTSWSGSSGQAHGASLYRLARAHDDRPVVAEREAKSISVEDTYDTDLVDRRLLEGLLDRHAGRVTERLRKARLSGRTVTVKIRLHDFTTHTRSTTLAAPTDNPRVVARLARALLAEVDTSGGVRLLGVGVSGLADWIQEDLFDDVPTTRTPPSTRGGRSQPDAAALDLDRITAPGLGAGAGRRARRARPGLGVGLRRRPGDGALRDRTDRGPARCGRSGPTTRR